MPNEALMIGCFFESSSTSLFEAGFMPESKIAFIPAAFARSSTASSWLIKSSWLMWQCTSTRFISC